MRGPDVTQEGLFVTRQTADYVPEGHPLLAIREILNRALREMDVLFESIYDDRGRYSVPPERLLRGLVLQSLYGIRSERLLCEQLGYNMLYRWFVGLSMEDVAWDHSTYTHNRDRLIEHEVVRGLFGQVMQQAKEAQLLSDEHFSVDGTLIRAWASHKSFVPKDGPPPPSSGSRSNPEVDFKRQKRSNDTHASTTDPDARLFTKSNKGESIPAYLGHVLMDNRGKLAIDTRLTLASGTAERDAAIEMLAELPGEQHKSVGADKNYDTADFVTACREINVTPHVAQNTYQYDTKTGKRAKRNSRIDGRTTRHPGYAVSQVIRKMIETLFGDGKQHGGTIRQVKLRGRLKVNDVFTLAMLTVNLRRLPALFAARATMAGSG
ncbi:MAG: IS5 family transposase [Gemmatimonadaceae bacterium]|nr:IS5 family transposase [Gemmatimonadaceae bacterium]